MQNINAGYRSPLALSRLAMGGIALIGLCSVLAGLVGIAQAINPGQSLDLGDGTSTSVWVLVHGIIALIQFPTYIGTVVFFLMWLYRTYVNLPALNAESIEFTPGWAVGWWFIPFLNLVKPYQAVRNVWAASDPDIDHDMGFLTPVQPGAPAFMSFWWALWLLGNISTNVASRFYDVEDPRLMAIGGYAFMFSGVLWFGASALAIKVVLTITDRQEDRFRKIGISRQQEPPPPPTFGH